jgi:hypothetical protein
MDLANSNFGKFVENTALKLLAPQKATPASVSILNSCSIFEQI